MVTFEKMAAPPLLRLPAELHDAIFAHVFDDTSYKLFASPQEFAPGQAVPSKSNTRSSAPLLICRDLHQSALNELYRKTTFELLVISHRKQAYACTHGKVALPAFHRFQRIVLHIDWLPFRERFCQRSLFQRSRFRSAREIMRQISDATALSRVTLAFDLDYHGVHEDGPAVAKALQKLLQGASVAATLPSDELDSAHLVKKWPACQRCEGLRRGWDDSDFKHR